MHHTLKFRAAQCRSEKIVHKEVVLRVDVRHSGFAAKAIFSRAKCSLPGDALLELAYLCGDL
jgi:hypothetical protein